MIKIRRALLSVSDKTGIVDLAKALIEIIVIMINVRSEFFMSCN